MIKAVLWLSPLWSNNNGSYQKWKFSYDTVLNDQRQKIQQTVL